MKKNYSLFIILLFSVVIKAQDLRVTWDNYTEGEIILSPNSINLDFTVTNDGDTIHIGDTLLFSYQLGPQLLRRGDLAPFPPTSPLNFSASLTNAPLIPGDFLNISNAALNPLLGEITLVFPAGTPVGTRLKFCALAYAQGGGPFDTTFTNDLTPENNRTCVFYERTAVGIEENLSEIANDLYISNNNLVINNSSFDFNSNAIVNVTNLAGKIVQTEELPIQKGMNEIALKNLAKGTYIVSIQLEEKFMSKKVVIY